MSFEDLLNPELFDQLEKEMENPTFQLLLRLQEILLEYDASLRTLQKRFVTQFQNAITEFSNQKRGEN